MKGRKEKRRWRVRLGSRIFERVMFGGEGMKSCSRIAQQFKATKKSRLHLPKKGLFF